MSRLQDSLPLRTALSLPPKRLSTPRSALEVSPAGRGLLLGAPVLTQAGLPPAGLVELPGRNMDCTLGGCDPARDLGARVEAELVQDAAHVAVDGALGDEQARADLLVAQAVGDQ